MSSTDQDVTAAGNERPCLWLTVGAGLAGAAGVALGAAAAHRVDSPALVTASTILMIHAVAVLVLASRSGGFRYAGMFMLVAVALFSGDIALHTLAGSHIFPYAAPIGGSSLILSWLVVAGLGIAGTLSRR